MSEENKSILYVDDDADDREFFVDAIKTISPFADIVLAENGVQALDYLDKTLNASASLPSLIVLDINMPLLDGKETFQRIRKDQRLQNVPVVIFTSSFKPADKELFNNQGIEFITKPSDFTYMNNIANRMLSYCS
jgi:CheY-like chemotaxis protein